MLNSTMQAELNIEFISMYEQSICLITVFLAHAYVIEIIALSLVTFLALSFIAY